MSFEFIKKLPTPQEIREKYPLSEELAAIKKARDEEIRKVFTGESDKFLVIIGPCSADNEEAVLDYAGRLAKVNEKVGDKDLLSFIPTYHHSLRWYLTYRHTMRILLSFHQFHII